MGRIAAGVIGFGLLWGGAVDSARGEPLRYRLRDVVSSCDQGDCPFPRAMNKSREVVGVIRPFAGQPAVPFSIAGRIRTALPRTADTQGGEALDIHDRGLVAGWVFGGDDEGSFAPFHPVVWEGGNVRQLPLPAGGGWQGGRAQAVNGAGHAAGVVFGVGPGTTAVFWGQGAPTVIAPAPSVVNDLNDAGLLVGCTGRDEAERPFAWQAGVLRELPPAGPGLPGCATAVNGAGVIVGRSGDQAVMWRDGRVIVLGGGTRNAIDVNDRGEVVGFGDEGIFSRDAAGRIWPLEEVLDRAAIPDVYGPVEEVVALSNDGHLLVNLANNGFGDAAFVTAVLEPLAAPGTERDTTPPSVALTGPAAGVGSDLAVLSAEASDDVAIAGVQFFVDGVPVGPEVTAPPFRYELDLLGYSAYDARPTLAITARARDTAGNVTMSPPTPLTVENDCRRVERGQVVHGPIGVERGRFTLWFTGSPIAVPAEGGLGVANGRPGGLSGAVAAAIFAPDGELKARDGATYRASGQRYRGWPNLYRFRMEVDVPSNRYSVWVKLPNEPERQIASGFRFRSRTGRVDHWVARVDEASEASVLSLCNIRLGR